MTPTPPDRCRIVLVAPPGDDDARVAAALAAGDVASLIVPGSGDDEAALQRRAERLVPMAQERGVAALVAGEPRLAARVGADGVHLETGKAELAAAIAKHGPDMIVGCGGARDRDRALELGETRPDYIFFGRFGYDTRPEPHRRNLALGAWWSEIVTVPCIVLGGCDVASVSAVAATGADFVALGVAVFAEATDPGEAVARANALLDDAPRFETRL